MWLTILGLLISLASPIVAIYLYEKNKRFVMDMREKDEQFLNTVHTKNISREQSNQILQNYIDLHNSSKDKGISALIKAGVGALNTEDEVTFVIDNIQLRLSYLPLGSFDAQIRAIGLLNYFKNVTPELLKDPGVEKFIHELTQRKNSE